MKEGKITVALLSGRDMGDGTSIRELALQLDSSRFRIVTFCFGEKDLQPKNLDKNGREVFYFSEKLRVFGISLLWELTNVLKSQGVDILHCQSHKAAVYGTIAAMFAKTPVVLVHVHGLGRSRNLRRRLMNLLLFRKINKIVPVANSVKEDVLRNNWFVPDEKLFVLENSVDYKRFAEVSVSKAEAKQMLGVPEDAFVYGTVGRLAPTKGLSYLIEAFCRVKEQIPAAQLVLLGEGRIGAELQKQAANTPYHSSIHFLGYRQNIEQLLRGIDVLVLASVAEGMPRAILEAMASGVPCVATGVGGIPEIINSEDAGFLVPAGDPAALVRAMVGVAKMPKDALIKLIQNAQNRIQRVYSHDVVREKLKKLYESEYNICCSKEHNHSCFFGQGCRSVTGKKIIGILSYIFVKWYH